MFVLFMLLKFMKCLVYVIEGNFGHATGITLNVNEGSSSPHQRLSVSYG